MTRINVAPMNNICAPTMVPTMPFLFRSTEHMRRPRLPLVGEERAFIERIVKKALETRPAKYRSVD